MMRYLGAFALAAPLLVAVAADPASAQKAGGILKMYDPDSPASMSIHEEATIVSERPMMGVFNNLVMFDQHVKQNSLQSIVPDLATGWSWNEEGTELTFPLRARRQMARRQAVHRQGRPMHLGPADRQVEREASRQSAQVLVPQPRAVTTNGDYEVTFHLNRPQPAFLTLLAAGYSPIYPCHVPPRDMRQHPIGTGPFKFVEFKPNEYIKVTRNPDYWKQGPALSRRHRVYDHPQPVDGDTWRLLPGSST